MEETIGGSFRDPSNFVYQEQNTILRKILPSGFSDYNLLIKSKLYDHLIEKKFLIPHEEKISTNENIIIKPLNIPFISYPYEWCFSQLKDAALLTLTIQKVAMQHGMSLKDASAYNVQFLDGKPIFIDTMSFEKYNADSPWVAYQQFCQHFLAPLALMAYTNLSLNKLMLSYINGIPLQLAVNLLPFKSRFSIGLYLHLHLHEKIQRKTVSPNKKINKKNFSEKKLIALIEHLESTINTIQIKKKKTTWQNYYSENNYSSIAFEQKCIIVKKWLDEMQPNKLIDFGSNDGYFTRIATNKKIKCIAADFDPITIENCYLRSKIEKDEYILPLQLDLANPSPNIGWHNNERDSFIARAQTDCIMALALIHHLTITNNIPLSKSAEFFAELSDNLIIEFIPKTDSMIKKMLQNRKDIFHIYNKENFESIFSNKFFINKIERIHNSERTLYWMKRIASP